MYSYNNIAPTKNSAFRLHFILFDSTTPVESAVITGQSSWTTKAISKDSGAFTSLTNSPVEIGNGWYYVDLTSDEMNADIVLVVIRVAGKPYSTFSIRTTSSGGAGLTAQQVWEYGTRTLTSTIPSASDIATAVWAYVTRSLTGASGDAISLEDSIPEDGTLPAGDLTVRQVLQLIVQRLSRHKKPRI